MIKLNIGSWLTPAIVLVTGLGCASGPGNRSTVVEETITTTTTTTTVIAVAQPTTRPATVRRAATQPVIQTTVRTNVPITRIITLKPKPAEPPKPLAEMWDGKGKCEGIASFYAGKFLGRKTANGETYTGRKLTAAHRVLPFGTCVRVTNLENGLDVIVRINDRGPFIAGRVIDLSPAAARKLHMTKQGVVKVKLETVAAWMAE